VTGRKTLRRIASYITAPPPHDDPPAKRRPEPYLGAPVTLGHMGAHGCSRLLIYCSGAMTAITARRSTPIAGRMIWRSETYVRKRSAPNAAS
jgi:hypothetical protein